MAYTSATLTGTYQKTDGTPAEGVIEIIPNSKSIVDAAGDVILSGRVKVTLDGTGSFTVDLPPTDDATLEPATGRQYTVAAKLRHSHLPAVAGVELASGATVDMADVVPLPVVDPAVTLAATPAQLAALETSVTEDLATKADTATVTALDGRVDTVETDLGAKVNTADKGVAGGVATLDGSARLAEGQVPARLEETALSATYARVVTPEAFGSVGDGTTDDTAAVQAALNAAYAFGGGTVRLRAGKTYRCNGQLSLPSDGLTFPGGRYVRITGEGNDGVLYPSGSTAVLDLRYSGSNAKLLCLPRGVLELDHFTLTDKGTSSTPFLLSTNTIVNAHDMSVIGNPSKSTITCDQDVFVFGGSVASAGGAVTSGFQGYGSTIQRVQFARIRRAAHLRVWANSIVVRDNLISSSCGAAGTQAAIELDPTADAAGMAWGNVISGNLIQMNGYTIGVKGIKAERNFFSENSFWDQPAGWVADYKFETNSIGNVIRTGGPTGKDAKHIVADGTSYANAITGTWQPGTLAFGVDLSGPVYLGGRTPDYKVRAEAPLLIAGPPDKDGLQAPLVVQSQQATPEAAGKRLQQWKTNPNDTTNPNVEIGAVLNSGELYIVSPNGGKIRNSVFQIDNNGLTRYTGNNLTIDPGASGRVNIKRNGLRLNSDGSGATHYSGSGAPTISATAGDAYWRTDGGAGTWLYRCTGGTAWVAVI